MPPTRAERPPSERTVEVALLDRLDRAITLLERTGPSGSWWDQLPDEASEIFRGLNQPQRVELYSPWSANVCPILDLLYLPDRLELRLSGAGTILWQRALFYRRPPSP